MSKSPDRSAQANADKKPGSESPKQDVPKVKLQPDPRIVRSIIADGAPRDTTTFRE